MHFSSLQQRWLTHCLELTPSISATERGSHLRVQQDPAEYQKPLKLFQIPEYAPSAPEQGDGIMTSKDGESMDQSSPSDFVPTQTEKSVTETPPECEGWTGDMEKHAREFLKGADIEQVQVELWFLYPATEHMAGLGRYLEKLNQEIEAQEPDKAPPEQTKEPAGWTDEMTEFVEGSLCAGNDVQTTVNLFRLERKEAFDIKGLEEHVEKLKKEYGNKKKPQEQPYQITQ